MHLACALDHDPNETCVEQYIYKYCADTVTAIEFVHQTRFLLVKPFENVEFLAIEETHLRSELPNLVKWFPKLRHLEIG